MVSLKKRVVCFISDKAHYYTQLSKGVFDHGVINLHLYSVVSFEEITIKGKTIVKLILEREVGSKC